MTQINLTSDQTALLTSATDPVVITDSAGNFVAKVRPKVANVDPAILEEAERRLASDQARIPSKDVLAKLDRLKQQAEQ